MNNRSSGYGLQMLVILVVGGLSLTVLGGCGSSAGATTTQPTNTIPNVTAAPSATTLPTALPTAQQSTPPAEPPTAPATPPLPQDTTATPVPAGDRLTIVAATLGNPFQLHEKQKATIASEGLKITFDGVTDDSRCPIDMECYWEGQIIVGVTLERNGKRLGYSQLSLYGQNRPAEDSTVRIDAYEVSFVRLDPYPGDNSPITQPTATFTIRLAGQSAGATNEASAVPTNSPSPV